MTVENLHLRLAGADNPEELVEGVRDAMRRGYTDDEIASIVGPEMLAVVKGLIVEGGCNGLCLTGSDVGVPSACIAYAHPSCPEHG
jgi:hypothetical protein